MILDVVTAFANDYLCWDNPEAITYEHTRRTVSTVDGTPVLPGGPRAAPTVDLIGVAKRRAITIRERIASSGAYLGSDVNWHLPLPVLPPDFVAKLGDVVIDSDNIRWTVIDEARNRLKLTWKLVCRNLSLVYGLRDEIQIERATVSYDDAGGVVRTFPPAGGVILYGRLPARVQPLRTEVGEERGIRGPRRTFDVIVDREVAIAPNDDRILWNGVYLEIVGYRQAERIDELPIVEAVQQP